MTHRTTMHLRACQMAAIALAITAASAGNTSASTPEATRAETIRATKPSNIRLIHGPQIYRLKTYRDSDRYEAENYRYALVAIMTDVRIEVLSNDDLGDPGAGRSAGNFSIGNAFLPESTHRSSTPKRRNYRCVVAYLDSGSGDVSAKALRTLDRVKVGQRVKVTAQPLLAGAPHLKYGRTYHRTAIMHQGGKYALTDNATQRQLKSIDCAKR